MKKTIVILSIAAFLLLAFTLAATVKNRMRPEEEPSLPEPANNPDLIHTQSGDEVIPPKPDDSNVIVPSSGSDLPPVYSKPLSPEVFQDSVLRPVLSCQPGTAGSSLRAAYASAVLLDFVTGNELRLADQSHVNRLMADAIALLTEEEQVWLPECVPGVVDLVEKTLANFEENAGLYEDSGTDDLVRTALNRPYAAENWERLNAAFDACIPGEDNAS